MSINTVALSGNLVRDPELNDSGKVMRLSLAVNERVKDRMTGEWQDRPSYFDCKVLGDRAASLAKFLHKGAKVTLDGRLVQERWEKDGAKRSAVVVIVNDLDLPPKADSPSMPAPLDEDDIPF